MCLELFEDPRGPGRPPLLLEATQEHLALFLHNILKHGIPDNASIAKVLCKGVNICLKRIGLSYRKASKTEAFKHSDAQEEVVTHLVLAALAYCMSLHEVVGLVSSTSTKRRCAREARQLMRYRAVSLCSFVVRWSVALKGTCTWLD